MFLDEACSWAEMLFTADINLPFLMPDEDNNFGDYFVWILEDYAWRHVQPKDTVSKTTITNTGKMHIYDVWSKI